MDNLFDRLNAPTESVRSHLDILNGYPLKFQDVSDDKRTEWVKSHSDANVYKQDGGKETTMQKASGTKEERPSPFVIPKKKRRTNDVLLDVKVSSRDFQHEILPAITKSYRQPQSSSRFVYDQVQTVQNTYLTDAYMEKRRELRGCGYVEKELSDSFAFLCMDIENEEETNRICREGLHVGNSNDSCLGHPEMGIHLCKHADILKPVGLNLGHSGHLIVFKVMKGKIKSVMENRSGSRLEPTPNFDCHLSSTSGNDLGSLNHHNLYESTQLYLYEYGDENVRDVPRNACPVAVVRFTYNESQKDVKSPDMSSPKFSMRSPLSVKPIPISPQIKTESQNFVVWTGHLTVKGLYACSVEMISKAGHAKPSRIGKGVNITHKMPIAQARKKYLQRVTSLDRKHEGYWNGYYINVCELHPVKPEGKSHFQKVMNYLGKHNCVAIRKLEKDVVLLLLTASELTFQLGLTKPHQYPVILYSIFLSRTSRKHGAVQTDPLIQSVITIPPAGLAKSVSSDPRLREKTKPLHINLPPSSVPHQGFSENSIHSTTASPSHNFPSPIYVHMPPPPSPTKGMRLATRVSPLVGVAPKRWTASSPPPVLILPAFFPSQPPPPLTPPVMAPTSPIQGLRSPVHAPMSPINPWTLIPPPPPPPPRTPTPGITPDSPYFSQSVDVVQSLYSPVTSPVTSPMNRSASPSQSLQYCLPQTRPIHNSSVYMGAIGQPSSPRDPRDPRDRARDPRDRDPRHTRDYPRSPREHAWDPRAGSGYISQVSQSVNRDPVLDGGKSPVSSGPLTSSPQHPTQPPPKLQTPPPPSSPRHESEGTRFESPRHFSSYPPKTSLLLCDQIKSEFTKQAKLLESIAHRNLTKSRTLTNQSNGLFSMSSDSESEMSDTEMNRIVKRFCVPTDDSMDTENSAKGSPSKPLQEESCIEEVMHMKELLNKSLEKATVKKTGKIKDLQKQEAEAMRQLLNSVSCDKNLQQKGKVIAGCKQKQSTLSVKPLPHKNDREKKVSKTCRDKTISSKLEKLDSKKPRERSHSQSESTRQLICKEKERNSHSKSESTRQSGCKEQEQKPILSKKPISGNESEYNLANSNQKHISKSKTSDKKCAKPREEACSSKAASYEKILEETKEQKSIKSRSRTSSTSSQSSRGITDGKKSVAKSSAPKPSKNPEQADTKPDRLKTFSEKYEESCSKKKQKVDQKTLPKHKISTSIKSSPVIAMKMDISLPVMASKSQTKTLHPEPPSRVSKSSSSKVRARAYSSSEVGNSVKVCDEQVNSAPKKAKLDPAISSGKKSSLWCDVNVNSDASKKPVPKIDEKQQTNEKKLSFKIKGQKSLLQKDPLSVNKGSKRGLKCGKSSSSSSSSSLSSSAKRTNAVKEKRKIKSGVGTNREKCSIEDVLPGLYSSDMSKLGRIPKLPKIPKRGQTSSKTDTASTSTLTPQAASNFITIKPSADINTSSDLRSSADVNISPALQSVVVRKSPALKSSDVKICPALQSSDVNVPPPGTPEPIHDAKAMLVVAPLPSKVEKTSKDGAVHPSVKHVNDTDKNIKHVDDADKDIKHVDDADKDIRTLPASMAEGSKPPKATEHAKSRTSIEICSEDNTSSNVILQETESKDENKSAGGHKHNQSLMEEPKDTSCNRPMLEQNVMLNPVPELRFLDQSSQKTSYSSSCCSSRGSSAERDSNTAPEKRRKHLRKRDKVESPLDSIMKSIRKSAAAKLRSSPQSWTDKNQSKSPGFSSDTERSNDSAKSFAGFKGKTDEDIEKRLQKKYDRDNSKSSNTERSTEVLKFDDLPSVNLGFMIPGSSNRICHVYSKENTAEAPRIKRQSAKRERSSSTERVSPALDDLPLIDKDNESGHSKILRLEETGELAVKDSRTQSFAQEKSITPEIVIPGLGDLPLSEVDQDCRSSNVVYNPLKLEETAEFSGKKTPHSTKRDRSITPEIVIPGLGDLPLKDLYDNSQTSKIVYDPLKLSNTAGYAREEAIQPAKRERSDIPKTVIPGLGDLPFPDQTSPNINQTGPTNTAGLEPFKTETAAQENPKLNTMNVDSQMFEERKIHSAEDRSSVFNPVKPLENASSASSSAKDSKPATPSSGESVQDVDSDDGELVVNSTRKVERAGWELKLRITIPNDLGGDARVDLATLDQTIRQSLHGHGQFSRLTPSETLLMTTINRVVHKKSFESPDQRQVEELNGQKKDSTKSKKSSHSPSIAELTRNLSPSLVEFARKHLSPSVTDFTRKHDPDIDLEPSDHLSDFVSYESWGSNRNTDSLTSSTKSTKSEKKCFAKNNHSASSTEKLASSESKPASPSTSSLPASMKYVPDSAFVPKKGSLAGKSFMDRTRAVSAVSSSSNRGADIVPPQSTAASSGYSSDLSDSSTTTRTVTYAPKKDSSSTVKSDSSDKILRKSKTNCAMSEKSSSETDNSESKEASDSTRVEKLLTDIASSSENHKNEKCVKEKSSAKFANISKMSATTPPETVSSPVSSTNLSEPASSSPVSSTNLSEPASSSLSSTKTSENASSSLSSTKTLENASSSLSSTKTSETASSSLLSTKTSENASSSLSSTKTSETESSSLSSTKTSETESSSLSSTKTLETASSSLSSTKTSETESSSLSSTKTLETASSSMSSTKTSETETSSLSSTKTMETASSSLSSTKTSETASSSLLSTKTSENASSSLTSTKTSETESSSLSSTKTS
ncbi:uncharacterized protein LOC110465158 [Mizuhopecten yessoensis]|uniref:DUF3715 domain-containing protein n=1 Tax=Mizuhopecten yessoensis TaxID=6573 RepID=A0A210PS63_MIZYE|nr:uncharacterized protein LOC110465158 [Mizuhopecten yessoensis]OWF39335.1 hypothetical protein KP79_PYT11793 [Mizuhopecten yessoensis]